MAEPSSVSFGALLRRLRTDAGLTQEELAAAASLSTRSVSDLERGINSTARKETTRLLADALDLAGRARTAFEAAARGRAPAEELWAGGVATATRTLPRDIASFTGREPELRLLAGAAADSGGVVGIHAIGGMAGVGKTAFAVHAAHRLAPQFPDGQVFLPLHGHTPGQRPVDPADALASLLLTAGVAAAQIPPGLEARMGLWRDRLAGKHLLLLLDDAVGSEQVRPLLPGTAGSLVLVTSRRHLTSLEDARAISLDALSSEEAARLLVRLAARPGMKADDPALAEITRLCGYLPLAVGMLARKLHHHPAWSAADLVEDLAAARDRLELMAEENVSVSAAFDLSYQDLTEGQQRLFRRLGLNPGTDIDAYAAAALDGTDIRTARGGLDALYDHYLLTEPAHGRYRLHDLIREHARALAAADDPSECRAAVDRLLDYYLHMARAADRHLARRTPAEPAVAACMPAFFPELPARDDALTWMGAERLNLHAATSYAAAHGRPGHAIALAAAMHGFMRTQGHWDQALVLHHVALKAARHDGDSMAEARALSDLGDMQQLTWSFPEAAANLTRALELYRDQGNRLGEANVLVDLGTVQRLTEDNATAAASAIRALELYRDVGERLGEAACLSELGFVQAMTGDLPMAAASLTQALELHRTVDDRLGEANTLNRLGVVQQAAGDYQAATASLTRALGLFLVLGDRLGNANAHSRLGLVQHATGDYPAAAANQEQALELYRELGSRLGEANALNSLGLVQHATGDYPAAAANQERALELYREIGNRIGEANAFNYLSLVQHATADFPAAAASQERALELYRAVGSRDGEAEILNNMGELALATAATAKARAHHEQALAIATNIASLLEEARALEGIGRSYLQDGQPERGAASLRQALAIYQRIGSPYSQRAEMALRDHST